MRATVTQVQAILHILGEVEARRRRLDLHRLDRLEASALLQRLTVSKSPRRVSTGGRPARPVQELPRHQQRLIRDLAANPNDTRHGTDYAYSAGRCKCESCRRAGTSKP